MITVKKVNNSVGRGVFANRAFLPDSYILKETPIVSGQFAWSKVYKYLACDGCLRPLETVAENIKRLTNGDSIPELEIYEQFCPSKKYSVKIYNCSTCGASFCSDICFTHVQHGLFCFSEMPVPLQTLDEAWRMIHMPPESTSIFVILKFCLKYLTNRSKMDDYFGKILDSTTSENGEYAHKLLGDKFKENRNSIFEHFITALRFIMAEKLNKKTTEEQDESIQNSNIARYLTSDGFASLFALFGRNQQGISTSPLSSWRMAVEQYLIENKESSKEPKEWQDKLEKFQLSIDNLYDKLDKTVGPFLDVEGVGLFKDQHLLNHSCNPNCEIQFIDYNFTLSLVAIREISQNEELTISYLDECDLSLSTRLRRKILAENYLFLCECTKCLLSNPDCPTDEEEEEEENEQNDEDNLMDCN